MSLTSGSNTYAAATNCSGIGSANQSGASETTALNTAFQGAGAAFVYLAKTDEASSSTGIGGITFTLTVDSITSSGHFTLTWVDGPGGLNLPIDVDLAFMIFAGNNQGDYLFSDVLLPASPTSGTGSWDITFLNNGGQIPGISHMTVAGRFDSACTSPLGCPGTEGPPPTAVPEPATLALFGGALLAFGSLRRRKRI